MALYLMRGVAPGKIYGHGLGVLLESGGLVPGKVCGSSGSE